MYIYIITIYFFRDFLFVLLFWRNTIYLHGYTILFTFCSDFLFVLFILGNTYIRIEKYILNYIN